MPRTCFLQEVSAGRVWRADHSYVYVGYEFALFFKVTSGRLWKIAADTDQGRHPAAGAFTQVDGRWELRIQRAIKEKGGKTGACRGRGVVCLVASGQSTMDGIVLD